MREQKKARPAGGTAKQAAGCDTAGQQSRTQYSTTGPTKARIYDLLPVGGEHTISRSELASITGMPDRQLRRQIAAERRAGLLILSSAEIGGGYFRPADVQELRRWVAMMKAHASSISDVLHAAEQAIAATGGK